MVIGRFHWRVRERLQIRGTVKDIWVDKLEDTDSVPVQRGKVFAKVLCIDSLQVSQLSSGAEAEGTSEVNRRARPGVLKVEGLQTYADLLRAQRSLTLRETEQKNDATTALPGKITQKHSQERRGKLLHSRHSSKQESGRSSNQVGRMVTSVNQRKTSMPPWSSMDVTKEFPTSTAEERAAERVQERKKQELKNQQEKVTSLRKSLEATEERNELRRQLATDLKPKVDEWSLTDLKAPKNIRSLLSTLQNVLWEEALQRWKPVGLPQLVTDPQVKRLYKKAVILVHPDKVKGEERAVVLAQLIFDAMNKEYKAFEQESR